MEKNNYVELLIPAVMVCVLVAFADPFMLLMPTELVICTLAVFAVCSLLFVLYIWKEKVRDEREMVHRLYSSRGAFLAGSGTLVVATIFQVLVDHRVDPWILVALGAMVIAKALGSLYSSRTQ